jgi:hypothetical protein
MSEPSVKGSMLLGSVVSTRRQRDDGIITASAVEKYLSDETLSLLGERITITRWYPMWQFNELQALFWEEIAHRDPEVARAAGAESFRSMQKTGRYQQFEYAERADRAASKLDVLRQTRMISSILSGYYNFLDVDVQLDPATQDLQIVYDNAELFTEPLRYSTEGFMDAVSRVRGGTTTWSSERVLPGRIIYTLPNAKSS